MNSKTKLLNEIKQLKIAIANAADFDEKLELEKKRADLISEFYLLYKEEKEKSPTITAKEILSKRPPILEFFQTGIKAIDDNLGGLIRGGLIQLAASSGAGKTTITTSILANLATYMKVAHFDFEMGEYKLFFLLEKFLKTEKQKENYLVNFESYKLDDLIKEIVYLTETGVKVFLIDSKMKIETKEKDTYKSASLISHELGKLTKTGNITIILINQISEQAQREGRAELKGSGDQTYDSDVILFLYKIIDESVKVPKGEPPVFLQDQRGIRCFKNRFGKEHFKDIIYKSEIIQDKKETTAQVIEMPNI